MGITTRRTFLRQTLQLTAGALLAGCQSASLVGAANASVTAFTDHRGAALLPPLAAAVLQPDIPTPEASLSTKIGQMIMVGFNGRSVDMRSKIVQQIADGLVGSVVLFGRNVESPEQLQALTATLHGYSPHPLLIAADQEGGWVTRLPRSFGIVTNYSAQFLGENPVELTQAQGDSTGKRLAELGINLNLAPVVDLNTNPTNPVIGRYERSYSADPAVVTTHARSVIESHRAHKVFCTLKHFPGHGSSRGDTHYGFVDVTDTWNVTELAPYAALIGEQQCDVIMTAHIFNATLDPDHPATLSQRIITGILREQLGYTGVVISDDMQMGAIAHQYELETAVRLALEAGVDIIAFSNNIPFSRNAGADRLHEIMLGLVEAGTISQERIDQSYNRIMQLKRRLSA
ncbi:MAG: glycoside hydrolase family 3 protein [Caldilineaceae bacterium]|nr:glycoside hydrolase family 3 protein [Caldilineaceae bacterium]